MEKLRLNEFKNSLKELNDIERSVITINPQTKIDKSFIDEISDEFDNVKIEDNKIIVNKADKEEAEKWVKNYFKVNKLYDTYN